MPGWWQAGGWGLRAGSALLVGAALGYLVRIPPKIVASIMAFGAGVLLSAVSFELISEAYAEAGLLPTTLGAIAGAVFISNSAAPDRPSSRRSPPWPRARSSR